MLVDTSVWVDHLRRPEPGLIELLDANEVDVHPFVIGELACGHLKGRGRLIRLLLQLPVIPVAAHEEALAFVERRRLHGRGVGWVDIHLASLGCARLHDALDSRPSHGHRRT